MHVHKTLDLKAKNEKKLISKYTVCVDTLDLSDLDIFKLTPQIA